MPKVDVSGALFHARHAFMPNRLGYCGPDDRGLILEHLQESTVDEKLVSILRNFEAAYPFIHLIGKSNHRDPFDQDITEAYWIGNKLLNNVAPKDFYNFTLTELGKKNGKEIRSLFQSLRDKAIPHHTFYVLSTTTSVISDIHHTSSPDPKKISEIMDNCRIALGTVLKVEKNRLRVKYRPLYFENKEVLLGDEATRKVEYDPNVPSFGRISEGDQVSLHWNFACDVLSGAQAKNLIAYTQRDIRATNLFLRAVREQVS
jgi:Family of unknown function (DUF6390)